MKALMFVIAAASLSAQVRLPDYTHEVLGNGAVVDVVTRRGVPLVSLEVVIKGGAESDPAGKGGLASVTADLLRRGTRARTADQFSDEVDFMGARFSTSVTPQATVVSAQFLAKDTERALELIVDALVGPVFPETEVNKALAERIENAKALKDEPAAASSAYFQGFFFGPRHPYAHRADGDELTLASISRADITGYHARMYAGRNIIVVAAGDFESGKMMPQLARAFGRTPAGTAYEWRKEPLPARSDAPRLLLVDKPGSAQTYFRIGKPGITRTHPDRVPIWLVDTLFGGRFTSMLNEELRVNSGLTYGANSWVDGNRLTGRIAFFSYTRTEDTAKAIDLALDVVKRLREKGITAEQLASTKSFVEGQYPTERLETSGQIAAMLSDLELFGLGRDEVDQLFARVDAVTLDQANAVAKRYFGAGDLVFTLVGDAAKIRESVRKYAPSVVEKPLAQPGF
jgi:zinc protease